MNAVLARLPMPRQGTTEVGRILAQCIRQNVSQPQDQWVAVLTTCYDVDNHQAIQVIRELVLRGQFPPPGAADSTNDVWTLRLLAPLTSEGDIVPSGGFWVELFEPYEPFLPYELIDAYPVVGSMVVPPDTRLPRETIIL